MKTLTTIALLMALCGSAVVGCAPAMTDQQAADAYFPGVDDPNNGLNVEQRLQLLQMENQNWNEQQQRTEEMWNRLQQASRPIYVRPW